MNDSDVLDQVRESVSGIHMHTPVETIMAKGRRRRRHQQTGLAAGGVAAVVALTVGVFAVIAPGHGPVASNPRSAQLAAFSIAAAPNGTSTLTLRKGAQYRLDPDALRQALAQHGIAALVTVNSMCDSAPEPQGLDQVISPRRQADGSVFTTFNPAAMPAGSKISIGYFPTWTGFALIEGGAPLHCTSDPGGTPVGAQPGGGAKRISSGQKPTP